MDGFLIRTQLITVRKSRFKLYSFQRLKVTIINVIKVLCPLNVQLKLNSGWLKLNTNASDAFYPDQKGTGEATVTCTFKSSICTRCIYSMFTLLDNKITSLQFQISSNNFETVQSKGTRKLSNFPSKKFCNVHKLNKK